MCHGSSSIWLGFYILPYEDIPYEALSVNLEIIFLRTEENDQQKVFPHPNFQRQKIRVTSLQFTSLEFTSLIEDKLIRSVYLRCSARTG